MRGEDRRDGWQGTHIGVEHAWVGGIPAWLWSAWLVGCVGWCGDCGRVFVLCGHGDRDRGCLVVIVVGCSSCAGMVIVVVVVWL